MAAASGEASALFAKAEQQKRELEAELAKFAEEKIKQSNIAGQQRLAAMMTQFTNSVNAYKSEVENLPDRGKALWERRATNLGDDLAAIQRDVDKQIGQFYKVQKAEEDRNKLFEGRSKKKDDDDEMTNLAKENKGLRDSASALDDVIGQGQRILGNLVGQNRVLKNARKKLLDAANVMGVSASLVSVIDRRQTGDKWLVYGGIVFTLFILFSLWYLLRW